MLLPPPVPCPPDAVSQGLLSCSAFSAADNGDPVYSFTGAIRGLELFLVLLPFPALLYPPEAGDQRCTHHTRGQCHGDSLHATMGFFLVIFFLSKL